MSIMRFLAPMFPMLSVAVLTFAALLPWGSSPSLRFLLPLLPLIGVHYWVVRKPQFMPVAFVFLCGLAVDALTSGPLGLWSMAYVVGFLLAERSGIIQFKPIALTRFIVFLLSMIAVVAALWVVSSIYFARMFDWRPLAQAVVGAAIAYPVIALLLWPLNVPSKAPALGSFTRGA